MTVTVRKVQTIPATLGRFSSAPSHQSIKGKLLVTRESQRIMTNSSQATRHRLIITPTTSKAVMTGSLWMCTPMRASPEPAPNAVKALSE